MVELHPDYRLYLNSQTHLKIKSVETRERILATFPAPDDITPEWWRGEIKRLAPKTLQARRSILFQALRSLGREEQVEEIRKVKLPKIPDSVSVEDLYAKEQLSAIFQHCQNPRDRAVVEVLYEGALRSEELLNMNFDDIHFEEDNTASIFVTGKTGTRSVPLFMSVPALREWLNHHPVGSGAVWVSTIGEPTRIGWSGLYQVVQTVLRRADIKSKRKLVHMFRHTRITELVKLGIRGQTLHKLVGWTKRSNMEAVYVHLSTADVVSEVRTKVFGLEETGDRYEPLIKPQKCPRCGSTNEPSARYCTSCNMPLGEKEIVKELERKQQEEDRINHLEQQLERISKMLESGDRYRIADELKKKKRRKL